MTPRISPRFVRFCLLATLLGGLLLSACTARPLPEEDIPVTEPVGATTDPAHQISTGADIATPEPPPTSAPLPTEPSQDPTSGCPLRGQPLYVNDLYGYCFSYPEGFTLLDENPENPSIAGPALDESPEPLRALLTINVHPIPQASDLGSLVSAYMSQSSFTQLPSPVERASSTLGGGPAEVLSDLPGQQSSREVLALHGSLFYRLHFQPTGIEAVKPDMEALYEAVLASFTFFEVEGVTQAQLVTQSFFEFGRTIIFSNDPLLVLLVEAETVEAVPPSPEILYSDAHPSMLQFRFLGYDGGRLFMLPYPFQTPRLMVFPTADFANYGPDQPSGFSGQLEYLRHLLDTRPDLAESCTSSTPAGEPHLPFLPWLNSAQVFCALPEYIEFSGGSGIRYLTYFSQGINPILDTDIFYTYQGLSDNGELYFSAVFPVMTGVFPLEIHPGVEGQLPVMDYSEQIAQLNLQNGDLFSPSLKQLDAMISSIHIER